MMHQPVQEAVWSENETEHSGYQSEPPKMNANQSANVSKLMTALAKAQGQIGDIERDRTVKVQSRSGPGYEFKYATLSAIIKGIKKPLSDNGISYTQVISWNDADRLYYLTTSLHYENEFISSSCPLILTDGTNQQFGSAATYMKRYTLSALVGVAADEDDDANAADGNEVKEMKAAPVRAPDPIKPPPEPPKKPSPDPIKDPEHYNQNVAVGINPMIRKIDVDVMEDGNHDWMGWGKEFINAARHLNNALELAEFEKVNMAPLKNMEINAPRMFANLSVSLIKVRKSFERQP